MTDYFSPTILAWVVYPLFIFFARVADVSLQTLRIILIAKGRRIIAPIIGFFELLIWLAAIGVIMKNLNNLACFFAYAGGFAAGSWVGMILEAKLSLGLVAVRVITRKGAEELINHLRWEGYGVTDVPAHGAQGDVHVIFTIVQRSDLQKVVKAVKEYNPNAFYSVEDIREISHGVVPKRTPPAFSRKALRLFRFQRKGK